MTGNGGADRVLGLETATRVCSVAVVESGRIVAEQMWDAGMQHAERLLPMASDLLAHLGWRTEDLDGVGVGAGPGSFTGVRIGMATAKGLCLGADLPLVCVPTLAALAYPVGFAGMPVCAMLDARRDEVYAAVYAFEGDVPEALVPDRVLPLADLLPQLPRPVLLVGEGAQVYRGRIQDALGPDARFLPPPCNRPGAGAVALLGAGLLARGEAVDLELAEPTYLRRSQAERVRDVRLTKGKPEARS